MKSQVAAIQYTWMYKKVNYDSSCVCNHMVINYLYKDYKLVIRPNGLPRGLVSASIPEEEHAGCLVFS